LSVLDLSDALAHRNGWDPRRHPVEQEAFLCQVIRDGRLAVHRTAETRERTAWHAAESAAVAAGSLRDEAFAAAQRAGAAQAWPTPVAARPRREVRVVGRLRPAVRWRPARAS
jgi:hypothetical protein